MGELNGNNGGNPFKNIMKKVTTAITAITMGIKIIPILLVATLLTSLLGTIFSFVINISASENTVKSTYNILDVEDMCELVEIKKNSSGEYYLDFIQGIDEKLEKVIEYMNTSGGVHNLPNEKEFLKEIIKAELIMKFPNLGGKIPEDSDGFQGAVNLTRITPNKNIGDLKDTGAGETSNIEQEGGYYPDNIVSEYESIVKSWKKEQELYIKTNTNIYRQAESEIDPGSDTGYWEEVYNEENNKKITIKEGTKVVYTGTYKNNTNAATGVITTYVEIKTDDITGFVKAQNLTDGTSESEKTSKIEIDKTKTRDKVTSRAPSKTIGDKNKQYVIAITAGYNNTDYKGTQNGDLKEEELNIQVAEKVEKLFEEYSNIKIVQTGSTSSNPGGVKKEDRATLIKNANPDMAVIIHFNTSNSGNETGVETIYKEGDGISSQFAEILSKRISEEMGLENRGTGTDIDKCGKNLLIMENTAVTGFPTVLTKGGFINGKTDSEVIKNGGIDKYAQGIVKAIEEYIKADKNGYSSTNKGNQTAKESIESKVTKLKYVPKETFKNYVENNNQEVLKVFTIDEEDGYKILTAKWSYEAGKITISENPAQDLRTSLEKYAMPFEYLLFFYIDTDYKDFSLELAKKVQESEVVMALQDNVSTTHKKITTEEKKEIDPAEYTEEAGGYDWKTVGTEEILTESCSTSIDITYIDTWCVKSYNESSYSEDVLNMGDGQEKIINLKGTVNTNLGQINESSEQEIDSGPIEIKIEVPVEDTDSEDSTDMNNGTTTTDTDQQQTTIPQRRPNIMESSINNKTITSQSGVIIKRNVNEVEDDAGGGKTAITTINVTYKTYQKMITVTDTISNQYDKGESKTDGKENVFVELYQKHKMMGLLREEWFLQILEKNDKTKNMVDLTKYLMFKATSENYGVIEYDFSIYEIKDFKQISVSGKSTMTEYIREWEHSSPPPTNSDGTKYIIETDGYGNPTVGYGVDIINGGFKKIFEEAGQPTHIGGEVDKEFVDALEAQEIQQKLNEVKAATSGLNLAEYQIHALTSRAYNCGVAGAITYVRGTPALNFVDSYNKYWKEENDNLFEKQEKNANFNHSLYSQFMSKPVTAYNANTGANEYSFGLERRRKSEWTLFQTGYYDQIDKWYQEGGNIIEVADSIHKYMEEHNYTYCVYYGNSYEECGNFGKSCGLNKTFEASKTGYNNTCCATYVSWVLQESGYITDDEHTDGATPLKDILERKGWIRVNNVSELQPGDVIYYSYGHVEIYAGDGKVYNAGSGDAIRGASPGYNYIDRMTFGLRAPN